jgi:uncharacterized protein DUF6600
LKPKTIAAILFAGVVTLLAPRPVSAAWSVSISYFHQELAPYGRWVHTRAYGEIWYPTVVASSWAPYVDGEWVYTDCGWTWVSYDPFADPFHYGTWVWVDPYGWCWEPGYVWGPAWVTWAWTDGYIGWAPLPATFAISATGYSGGPVTVAQNQYVFVPMQQFAGTNVSTVRVATAQNSTILARAQRTTRFSVSGGLVHASGPPTALVERGTGRPVRAVSVSSHKLRPTKMTAAGMTSGKRIPIVAPAHERAARLNESKERKASAPKIVHHEAPQTKGVPPKVATARHPIKEKAPARVEKIEKQASPRQAAAPRHEAKPSGQRVGEKPSVAAAGPPQRESHRVAASGGPPPKTVEKRHEAAPAPVIREEHRTAMNRVSGQQQPARHEAPPPQAAQAPPKAPPAVAARPPEHPQPQGQPREPKKEKSER